MSTEEVGESRQNLLASEEEKLDPPPAYDTSSQQTKPECHELRVVLQQPSSSFNPATAPPKPESYFILSLLATVCCCNIIGAIGVVYSFLSERHYYEGRHVQARSSSRKALAWSIAAIVVGVVLVTVMVVLQVVTALVFRKGHNIHDGYGD